MWDFQTKEKGGIRHPPRTQPTGAPGGAGRLHPKSQAWAQAVPICAVPVRTSLGSGSTSRPKVLSRGDSPLAGAHPGATGRPGPVLPLSCPGLWAEQRWARATHATAFSCRRRAGRLTTAAPCVLGSHQDTGHLCRAALPDTPANPGSRVTAPHTRARLGSPGQNTGRDRRRCRAPPTHFESCSLPEEDVMGLHGTPSVGAGPP